MFGDAAPGLARRRRDRLLERPELFGERPGHAVAMFADAVRRVIGALRDDALERREPFGQSPGHAVAMFADAAGRVIGALRDDALERREPFGQSPGHAVALLRDAVRLMGDAVRGLARRRRDRLLKRTELFGERPGHAVAMFADAVGRVIGALRDDALERREPLGQSPGRAVALLRDAVRLMGDAVRGLARRRRDRLLERREFFGERAGHAVAMLADAVGRVIGAFRDKVFEGGDLFGERRLHMGAVARHALGDFGALGQHDLLERAQAFGQCFGHAVTLHADRAHGFDRDRRETLLHGVGVFAKLQRGLRQIARQIVVQRLAARSEVVARDLVGGGQQSVELTLGALEHGARAFDMLAHPRGEPLGGIGQRRVERAALRRERLFEPPAHIGEPRRETVVLAADGFRQSQAKRLDALDHAGAMIVEAARQRVADDGEARLDIADALGEALRHAVARRADLVRHFVAGLRERRDQPVAMPEELPLDAAAGAFQREPDFLALLAERRRDAIAGGADLLGEMRRGARHLRRQRVASAVKRRARVVGVQNDGLALMREFVDQQSDAALVFAVGAFEVRYLGAHDHFEFAGARQRALDAVAHRRGFAADRLRERNDLFGRDGLGLDQADRRLGHRLGDETHLMRAARRDAGDEQEHDRPEQREQRQYRRRREKIAVPAQNALAVKIDVERPQRRPGHDRQRGHDGDRSARAEVQRGAQLADAAAVVVGGRRHRSKFWGFWRGRGTWFRRGRRGLWRGRGRTWRGRRGTGRGLRGRGKSGHGRAWLRSRWLWRRRRGLGRPRRGGRLRGRGLVGRLFSEFWRRPCRRAWRAAAVAD